jgi:hypothetical protein
VSASDVTLVIEFAGGRVYLAIREIVFERANGGLR